MFELVHGVEDELSRHGYSLLLATSTDDPEMRVSKLGALAARHVEGMVLVGLLGELSGQDLPADVPVVWLGGPSGTGRATVMVDEAGGITQILDHLTELGHRAIGYVSPPTWAANAAHRLAAFNQVLVDHGLDPGACPVLVCSGSSAGDGYLATRNMLAERGVTAIVAGGDAIAIGSLKAVHDEGLNCPVDVSVVGYDDRSLNDYLRPSLTAVRVPFIEMGTKAAKLLTGLIAKASAEDSSTVDPELVIRASTAPSPRSGG
jgi:LacI family transcriptional regulator